VNRPGTFLYHSGTHPQKQVYMGLYGAATQNAVEATVSTPAEAYPGVEYFNELVLFYSEIDPDLNAAINELHNPTGLVEPYSTSINYHPRWFLVNGEPYADGMADITTGVDGVTPLAAGQKTLVRFLSTAGNTHVPTLQGMHMSIHAEDGLPYTWQDGATVMGPAPREQYSVMLPPLKTRDAIVQAPANGTYAVYDGNGYMTNPSDPGDVTIGDTVGGMLRFLAFGDAGTNQPPVANANGPYSGVTGAPVTFDANGSTDDGTITQYDWDFGDGNVALDAGPTPSHTYAFDALATYPVNYTVTLTVTDDGGLTGTAGSTATIAANTAPTAVANGPYTGSVGTPVAFDGTGSTDDSAIVSYDWDFGDGNTGTGPTPSHTYEFDAMATYPVVYNVTLTVTDDSGTSSTPAAATATIAANQAPTADANGTYTGSTDTAVLFDGTGSFDPDGTIVSYEWDFDGDGVIDGSGPSPSHIYADAGTYNVTLTVTDNMGATASDTTTATIDAANLPPVADAGGSYTVSINDGGSIAFDGSGSSDPDGTIVSWAWDFGDGTFGTGEMTSHTYAAPSTYLVTLTVTDNLGATATDTAIASVVPNQAPVANDDTATVQRQGASVDIDVTDNDTDADGTVDPTTVVVTSDPARGSYTVDPVTGVVTYTSAGGQTGTVFLTYTVQDDQGAVSNEATVTINVTR
jgi:PKD repeat protein